MSIDEYMEFSTKVWRSEQVSRRHVKWWSGRKVKMCWMIWPGRHSKIDFFIVIRSWCSNKQTFWTMWRSPVWDSLYTK